MLSTQLYQSIGNQNNCSLSFQNLERSVAEYKSLFNQRKNVIYAKLATIANHQKHIDLLRRNPMMADRTVGPVYRLMEKDCILPE